MVDILLDFIFPKRCVGCGASGNDLCNECFGDLSISEQICPECGEESFVGWTHPRCKKKWGMDGLIVIYDYQDEKVRAAVDSVKFDFNRELVKDLLRNFRFESGEKFDYLVPVPLHYYRENWRGFNQAREVALAVGGLMDVSCESLLSRKRKTKQQSSLTSRTERERNVKEAFVIKNEDLKQLKGKRVLLIDDVFTTGADMRECTRVLKKTGVEVVWGLALAH